MTQHNLLLEERDALIQENEEEEAEEENEE